MWPAPRGASARALALAAALGLAARALRRRRAASRVLRTWPHGVEVRRSLVGGAGAGLFASRDFAAGELLGEYRGRVLSLLQAHQLENRDYLMGGFGINAHVDARFALDAAGRYVNDHFDAAMLNARIDKDRERKRARVVALRPIRAGEEIYASYGETYWRARNIDPATGGPLKEPASSGGGGASGGGGGNGGGGVAAPG